MSLYINGSNRKKNCYRILNDLKRDEDKLISLGDKNIKYCSGCSNCINGLDDYCVIDDDMREIYIEMKNTNKIIIASPIYMNFITGILKNMIDRLNPYSSHDEILKGKKIYLILTGQLDEEENEEIINNIKAYFLSLSEFMEFEFHFLRYLSSGDIEKIDDITKRYKDYDEIIAKMKLEIYMDEKIEVHDIEKIKKDLKDNLSEFRYEHSIMVAEEAKKLAEHYNLDEEKTYVTGIVHDIAKEFSEEQNKELVDKYQLSKELLLPEFRNIIHANIGAVVAKEWYGLDDEICEAIKYHTIGDISMSKFDKIIFLADKIARKNASPFIEKIRKLTYENLDEALKQFLIGQKEKIEKSGGKFHQNTLELLKSL